MKISETDKIICAYCYCKSDAIEWDKLTFSKCSNREMKRSFTHLNDTKALLDKSNTYYMCPKCSKWNKGSQLSVRES